jgi:hypothetical protein
MKHLIVRGAATVVKQSLQLVSLEIASPRISPDLYNAYGGSQRQARLLMTF